MKGKIRPWCRALILMGAAFLVCLSATPAAAQRTAQGAQGDSEPYRIGAGDMIRVDVAGRPDLTGVFTVSTDGTLVLPVIGPVQAEGRTASEVRSDLARRVSLFDRTSPQVTVAIVEYKSRKIFILGSVVLPGIYGFGEMPNLWDAIAEAGGPGEDADLGQVEIIPGDVQGGRTTAVVDVGTAIRSGRTATLPRLRPGDTVRVPRMSGSQVNTSTVLLFGAVMRPGPLPIDQAPDLATAISRSGGPTPDAKLSRVGIIRRSGSRLIHMKVNLDDYFSRANSAGNPSLEPGDTVFLPGKPPKTYAWLGALLSAATLASTIVLLAR